MDKYQSHNVSPVAEQGLAEPTFSDEIAGLRTLSAPQKEALTLRFEHDLSFEDIAKKLETSPTNARQLISRALRKLKTFAQRKGGSP